MGFWSACGGLSRNSPEPRPPTPGRDRKGVPMALRTVEPDESPHGFAFPRRGSFSLRGASAPLACAATQGRATVDFQ